jgi:hypothetical protein
MNVPINALVSVSMHPGVLDPHAEPLKGSPALAAGREAMAEIYRTATSIETAKRKLALLVKPGTRMRQKPDGTTEYLGDLRMTAGGLRAFHGYEDEFAAAAQIAFERAAAVFDRRYGEVAAQRERTAAAVESALRFEGAARHENIAIASEIRGYLRRAPDRVARLSAAIDGGDKQTVSAVLAGPAFLTNLTPEELEPIRQRATLAWAPTESAQLAALDAVGQRLRTASAAFLSVYEGALRLRSGRDAAARGALKELVGNE